MPFRAAGRRAAGVVLARRSVLGRMREIAESELPRTVDAFRYTARTSHTSCVRCATTASQSALVTRQLPFEQILRERPCASDAREPRRHHS